MNDDVRSNKSMSALQKHKEITENYDVINKSLDNTMATLTRSVKEEARANSRNTIAAISTLRNKNKMTTAELADMGVNVVYPKKTSVNRTKRR